MVDEVAEFTFLCCSCVVVSDDFEEIDDTEVLFCGSNGFGSGGGGDVVVFCPLLLLCGRYIGARVLIS